MGGSLVEPTWLAWDPDATCLALGYPDALLLCRLRPSLTVFASLPIQVGCVVQCGADECIDNDQFPCGFLAQHAASPETIRNLGARQRWIYFHGPRSVVLESRGLMVFTQKLAS